MTPQTNHDTKVKKPVSKSLFLPAICRTRIANKQKQVIGHQHRFLQFRHIVRSPITPLGQTNCAWLLWSNTAMTKKWLHLFYFSCHEKVLNKSYKHLGVLGICPYYSSYTSGLRWYSIYFTFVMCSIWFEFTSIPLFQVSGQGVGYDLSKVALARFGQGFGNIRGF